MRGTAAAALTAALVAGTYWPRALAQTAPNPAGMNESRLHRDFRVEKDALGACTQFSFGELTNCGQTLVMGQPIHIAVGSMPPQNGFAAGLAFVEHTDFKDEVRATYDIDGVASPGGSWRVGGYLKAYRQPNGFTYHAAPLLNVYSQSISLKRVDYYGLGPNTTPLAHTTFGFGENISGANLTFPTNGVLHTVGLIFFGEVDGRFPSVRAGSDSTIPSIERFFNDSTAPGFAKQHAYIETIEGVRLIPPTPKSPVRLNYSANFAQYTAPGNSVDSFRRMDLDFDHEIPLYQLMRGKARAAYDTAMAAQVVRNGPDNCEGAGSNIDAAHAGQHPNGAVPCPSVALTDKLEGSISLRAFISESFADAGSRVPFYEQPTIGGSDINGTAMLASYPDYRFRGPDLLLFRGTVEHSLGKLPAGVLFSVDEGKIGLRRDDVNPDHMRHTFSAGLTIHAGGLPVFSLLFAWGGHEGHHTIETVDSTLLGGGARPSLF